jgi:hypothetical protein
MGLAKIDTAAKTVVKCSLAPIRCPRVDPRSVIAPLAFPAHNPARHNFADS